MIFQLHRFKSATILRTHCKRQSDLKCEICSSVFCKEKAFKRHKDEGCEGIIEISHIPENKPAFIDCSSMVDVKVEEDFERATICVDGTNDFKMNDHSVNRFLTVSAVTDSHQIRIENKPKKSTKYKQKPFSEKCHPNDDDRLYCCYLCNRR